MLAFLEEIQASLDAAIYSPALASVLLVPDACGAIEYPQFGNGARYRSWYDTFVERPSLPSGQLIDGAFVWKVRNGMQHETALDFASYGFDRVIFSVPNRNGMVLDRNMMSNMGAAGTSAIQLDLSIFIERIIIGAKIWLATIQDHPEKLSRMDGLIQLRPTGLSPFVVGIPILS